MRSRRNCILHITTVQEIQVADTIISQPLVLFPQICYMKTLSTLTILFLFAITASGQTIYETRSLRPWVEAADTFYVKIKYTKDNQIKSLYQQYYYQDGEDFYTVIENYKQDKHWFLSKYKDVLKKEKSRSTIYSSEPYGKQFSFTEKGMPFMIGEGDNDETYLFFEYYENGNLKLVSEVKDDLYWNILEYKYPNGKDYDYGDFKDGKGRITHLNDDGDPCLECIDHQKKGKVLCPE